ncbi:malto-oligosyltrehalose trehalohydrolase [Luteibacter sp. Sphag1AF]|uniref:malto-oligosyltrehalose trehalohydrolase n=1 Tax=Luteibacter sp. Sphag1AF TaxID=2587031 RepID=UPI00161A1798|nr:malto-oligosyltrehalose trehalohydrolase [Luteibacter sp. Sphag1AF]MBB3226930.1 malto-oligosyltrehalose trehalohydrolase [Luteibacter sp. Sphag1AF]
MTSGFAHAMPYGAQPLSRDRTRFRLWAPDCRSVQVELDDGRAAPMRALNDGWFDATLEAPVGTGYRFRVRSDLAVPDPASRRQKDGDVHGFSVVTEPTQYRWMHGDWTGRPWREAVIMEVHAGAMGGFDGVRAQLPRLAALGITAVELMPVAQFSGVRSWGYDGVLPFAPASVYGTPDELKALVDEAHGLGLMVFLDVVYNHFGPDGNYLGEYASPFFKPVPHTPWGPAIAVDRQPVGDFFVHNALYWIEEFRLDGLRLDAVHTIANADWLASLAARVRAVTGARRHVHLMLENEDNQAHLLSPDRYDAQWNDDFHNAIHVLLTGETEGYYAHFENALPLLLRTLSEGFAWQGEVMDGKPRGERSAGKAPGRFINFLQNHDQIGNRPLGDRLTTLIHPDALNAAMALLLLAPYVPLLFMGEEYASRRPFQFFADFTDPELTESVSAGRRWEFEAFAGFSGDDVPDPASEETFHASRLDEEEARAEAASRHAEWFRGLLASRARYVAPFVEDSRSAGAHALGERAFRASWQLGTRQVLTIYANLGDTDITFTHAPSPSAAWIHGDASAIAATARGMLPARCTVVCLESSVP